MDITIDPASPVAPYEQVRLRIAALAADGDLAAGARLPPVRQLAADLGLAANTVARAYRELEQAGLVETRGRHGTVITAKATGTSGQAQRAAAALGAGDTAGFVPPVEPVTAEELAAYAGVEIPPGADPWTVLAASDDPATAALARWWTHGEQ